MVLWVDKAQLDLPGLEALMPRQSAAIWLPQKLKSVKAEFNSALLSPLILSSTPWSSVGWTSSRASSTTILGPSAPPWPPAAAEQLDTVA